MESERSLGPQVGAAFRWWHEPGFLVNDDLSTGLSHHLLEGLGTWDRCGNAPAPPVDATGLAATSLSPGAVVHGLVLAEQGDRP